MSPVAFILSQIVPILGLTVSCILHFYSHYQFINCCCPNTKRTRFPPTKMGHHRSISTKRSSILQHIQIYNNRQSNNCCCCQIDIMCDEILSKISCVSSKNEDLQCYPLLFLCYLVFCTSIGILTLFVSSSSDITLYLIGMSIIWELLFNYYRYYTTLRCVLTLSNTEENCALYTSIAVKFIVYAMLFMTCFVLSLIKLPSIWWCLITFVVLVHCVCNSYFIVRFSRILITQYESMREMDSNLAEMINDSMITSVVSMKRYSLCSMTISTLYLVALLLCNHYDYYVVLIVRYYPLCWCVLCFAFCMNFAKNREWIKERILNCKLKLRRRRRSHQNHMKNQHRKDVETTPKTNAELESHMTHALSDDDDDGDASASMTSLTTSDTTPPPPKVKKVPKIRKSRSSSEYKTLRSKRQLTKDGLPRSFSDRSENKIPFSIIIKQQKALTERETLLEQNEIFTPSSAGDTKLYTSRSANENWNPTAAMRRKQSCEDLHKSYSFTHNKVSAKPNKWMQSNEQRSISETPLHQMPQHIARAHTAEDMYNKQDLDDHDRALIALQESLKATSKSRSKSDDNLHRHTITMQRHHGIQSHQTYHRRPRRSIMAFADSKQQNVDHHYQAAVEGVKKIEALLVQLGATGRNASQKLYEVINIFETKMSMRFPNTLKNDIQALFKYRNLMSHEEDYNQIHDPFDFASKMASVKFGLRMVSDAIAKNDPSFNFALKKDYYKKCSVIHTASDIEINRNGIPVMTPHIARYRARSGTSPCFVGRGFAIDPSTGWIVTMSVDHISVFKPIGDDRDFALIDQYTFSERKTDDDVTHSRIWIQQGGTDTVGTEVSVWSLSSSRQFLCIFRLRQTSLILLTDGEYKDRVWCTILTYIYDVYINDAGLAQRQAYRVTFQEFKEHLIIMGLYFDSNRSMESDSIFNALMEILNILISPPRSFIE
eukprot:37608_1